MANEWLFLFVKKFCLDTVLPPCDSYNFGRGMSQMSKILVLIFWAPHTYFVTNIEFLYEFDLNLLLTHHTVLWEKLPNLLLAH